MFNFSGCKIFVYSSEDTIKEVKEFLDDNEINWIFIKRNPTKSGLFYIAIPNAESLSLCSMYQSCKVIESTISTPPSFEQAYLSSLDGKFPKDFFGMPEEEFVESIQQTANQLLQAFMPNDQMKINISLSRDADDKPTGYLKAKFEANGFKIGNCVDIIGLYKFMLSGLTVSSADGSVKANMNFDWSWKKGFKPSYDGKATYNNNKFNKGDNRAPRRHDDSFENVRAPRRQQADKPRAPKRESAQEKWGDDVDDTEDCEYNPQERSVKPQEKSYGEKRTRKPRDD